MLLQYLKFNKLFFSSIILIIISDFSLACDIYNAPPSSTMFVGREKFLNDVVHSFAKNKEKTTAITAIVGVAGAGKTQVASKFAEISKKDGGYQVVWWFDAEFPLSMQFSLLAKYLQNSDIKYKTDDINDSSNLADWCMSMLKNSPIDWLLIFDNASSMDKIQSFIPINTTSSKTNVLITTKNKFSWPESIEIPGLQLEEVEIAFKKLSKLEEVKPYNKVIDFLRDATFFEIEQTASRVRQNNTLEASRLLKELTEGKFINNPSLSLSIDHIENKEYNTFKLVSFMAFLHGKRIPKDLLSNWYNKHVKPTSNKEFNNALHTLMTESLVKEHEDNIYIHNVTQNLLRHRLKDNQKNEIIKDGLDIFLEKATDAQNIIEDKFTHLLGHSKEICRYGLRLPLKDIETLYKLIIVNIENLLYWGQNFNEAVEYIQQNEPYFTELTCQYPYLIAEFLNQKSVTLKYLGHIKASYALIIPAKRYAEDNQEIYMKTVLSIARRAQEVGNLSTTTEMLEEADVIINKYGFSLTKDSFDYYFNKTLYYHVLAHRSIDFGEYGSALKYANRATCILQGLAKKLGAKDLHPQSLLPTYLPQQLALTHLANEQSQYETIESLLQRINNNTAGVKTQKIKAFLYTIQADRLIKKTKFKDAEACLQQAFNIYNLTNKSLSDRYVAFFYKVKGNYFLGIGDNREALDNFNKALETYENSLMYMDIAEVKDLKAEMRKLIL